MGYKIQKGLPQHLERAAPLRLDGDGTHRRIIKNAAGDHGGHANKEINKNHYGDKDTHDVLRHW